MCMRQLAIKAFQFWRGSSPPLLPDLDQHCSGAPVTPDAAPRVHTLMALGGDGRQNVTFRP